MIHEKNKFLSSSLSLFDYGIRPIIIEDCCDTNSDYHTNAINIIRRNIGDQNVISYESLISSKDPGKD